MLRPRGRSPALASLNKALGREVRNVCSVRGWGAGYVELCGSWLCFKTIPHWRHRQQLLVAKKEEGELKCLLTSCLCGSKVLRQPPHLPISLFLNRTASSPCQTQKKKKTCFRCKAKLPIQMQRKKTTIKKSRGRFLFIRLVSGDYQDRIQQFVVHMLTRETHAWIPNVNI